MAVVVRGCKNPMSWILRQLAIAIFGEGEFHRYSITRFEVVQYSEWTCVDLKAGSKRFRLYPSDFRDDFCSVVDQLKDLSAKHDIITLFVNPGRAVRGTDGAIVRIEQPQVHDGVMRNDVLLSISLDFDFDWDS